MSDATDAAKRLRERIGVGTEDRLGRALSELLESPLFTGAIGRAFDAREKAAQAQMLALGALNLPSAADIERLTRRLRAVTHRLEAIEDGVDRLDGALAARGIEARLGAIEQQLEALSEKLETAVGALGSPPRARTGAGKQERKTKAARKAKAALPPAKAGA